MKSQQVNKLVERYKKAIAELDARRDRMSDSDKRRYETQKERFVAQLQSWQKISEREVAQLHSNLDEAYNKLESVWYNAQQNTTN